MNREWHAANDASGGVGCNYVELGDLGEAGSGREQTAFRVDAYVRNDGRIRAPGH